MADLEGAPGRVRHPLGWALAVVGWLRRQDRGFAALRRAARTAIVMPALFALGRQGHRATRSSRRSRRSGRSRCCCSSTSAAPMRDRLRNQAALARPCGGAHRVATLVSQTTWLAARHDGGSSAFGVLFIGVASSVLASATQTLLLAFILPVSLAGAGIVDPGSAGRLGAGRRRARCSRSGCCGRLPARDPVRGAAIAACRALAARLRAEIASARAARAERRAARRRRGRRRGRRACTRRSSPRRSGRPA